MTTSVQTQSGAAVEKRQPASIKELLTGDSFRSQIIKALPRHLTADRFIRVALTAMTRTPNLAKCSQASFFNCLLTLSQLGLEPDGRRAHLIPYGTDCQLIVDYKGLAELAMRSGTVSNVHADKVCDNDEFVFDRGQIVKHTIDFKKPRGNTYAYYAICRFKDGTEKAEVMTRSEVDAIRERSKAKNSGPWVTDYDEMAKKTVFRRLSKWLPMAAEFRDALDHDADTLDLAKDINGEVSFTLPENEPIQQPKAASETAAAAKDKGAPQAQYDRDADEMLIVEVETGTKDAEDCKLIRASMGLKGVDEQPVKDMTDLQVKKLASVYRAREKNAKGGAK